MNKMVTFLIMLIFSSTLLSQNNTLTWQTTHNGNSSGQCRLESNKINLTIHAFHIDVEEEATIFTQGNVWSGDASTIEIVSEFTATPGTAIRSMLLWNGNQILKAKLRDKRAADSLYEATVDRSKPQPVVRDPAIIEQIAKNRYKVRIYPVAINSSRKIRILYSIPLQSLASGPSFSINSIFAAGATVYPAQMPITVKQGNSPISRYVLSCGTTRKQLQYNATYLVPFVNFRKSYTYYYGSYLTNEPVPFNVIPDSTSFDRAYLAKVNGGLTAGDYYAVFAQVPDSVRYAIERLESSPYTLEARITTGTKSYIADNPYNGCIGVYLKTSQPWDKAVHWTVYDSDGYIAYAYSQTFIPDTNALRSSMLPFFWAAKYSLDQGNQGLGALYGFVDNKMSLLALERDSLPSAIAVDYQEEGVPPLLPPEIVLAVSLLPNPPVNDVMFEINVAAEGNVSDLTMVNKVMVQPNGLVQIQLKNKTVTTVIVALYDLRGRLISKWNVNEVRNGQTSLVIPNKFKGRFLLRIQAGSETLTSKVVLL